MITLLWRTDLHLADKPPESRVDDWTATLLGKCEQVGQLAGMASADAVLDGGDFFHVKAPMRNSHSLVQRVADLHAAYPCPVYANIGNHDVKFGEWTFLPESPLGVLFATRVFNRCYDEHEANFESDGFKVRVVGIPYHGVKYDRARFTSIKRGSEDFLVVMAHCLASPAGGSMFDNEDIVAYKDLVELDADVFCFGHWHKNQGITEIADGKWVVNVGSLSRGALTQDDTTRIPECVVMRFAPGEVKLERVQLTVEPAQAVFDIERAVRVQAREMTMGAFVESIQGTLDEDSRKPLLDLIRESDTHDLVKERAIDYVERAG